MTDEKAALALTVGCIELGQEQLQITCRCRDKADFWVRIFGQCKDLVIDRRKRIIHQKATAADCKDAFFHMLVSRLARGIFQGHLPECYSQKV